MPKTEALLSGIHEELAYKCETLVIYKLALTRATLSSSEDAIVCFEKPCIIIQHNFAQGFHYVSACIRKSKGGDGTGGK